MKREVDLTDAKWLLEPGCVLLVTSGTLSRANIMALSWQTPVNSREPCLALLSINRTRYTFELVRENPELVLCVPGAELVRAVHSIGSVSGRKIDKFREHALTPLPSKLVKPPSIAECPGHLECRVNRLIPLGAHVLLVCEALRAEAEEGLFDGRWIPERFHSLHYLGGKRYGVLERTIEADH